MEYALQMFFSTLKHILSNFNGETDVYKFQLMKNISKFLRIPTDDCMHTNSGIPNHHFKAIIMKIPAGKEGESGGAVG